MAYRTVTRFGKTFQIDENLASNLDEVIKINDNDSDAVIMIDGREGSGKSKGLGEPISWYISGSNVKVVFSYEQFKEAYSKMPPRSTVWFDEFVTCGMSVQAMNKEQQKIIQYLTMSRKRLVNVILVVPNYFMFGWYFTTHRSVMLLHTYQSSLLTRGDFFFYSGARMATMWNKLRKVRVHNLKWANFTGKFPKYQKDFFYPDEDYQKAKDEAIASLDDKPKSEKENKKDMKWKALWLREHKEEILEETPQNLAEMYGMTERNWQKLKIELTKKNEEQ